MEVITGTISDTMNTSTASATPQEEVDGLIQQVADENQLDLMDTLDEVRPPGQAQEAKKKKMATWHNDPWPGPGSQGGRIGGRCPASEIRSTERLK